MPLRMMVEGTSPKEPRQVGDTLSLTKRIDCVCDNCGAGQTEESQPG